MRSLLQITHSDPSLSAAFMERKVIREAEHFPQSRLGQLLNRDVRPPPPPPRCDQTWIPTDLESSQFLKTKTTDPFQGLTIGLQLPICVLKGHLGLITSLPLYVSESVQRGWGKPFVAFVFQGSLESYHYWTLISCPQKVARKCCVHLFCKFRGQGDKRNTHLWA